MAGKGSRTLLLSLVADTNNFNKGLKKGESAFKKFGKAVSAAAGAAALAVAAFAAKWLGEGVQAAIAAEKVERRFAKTLRNVTKATDAQVKATEEYITATQMATGVNDDELRASLERLVTATGKVSKAQKLQALALDISAGTGKTLEQVTMALVKAQNGQLTSLRRLGIPLSETILKAKDSEAAFKVLAQTFEGQAAEAADTTAGKLARLNERLGEIQESAGAVLLDGLQPLTDWALSPEGAAAIDQMGAEIRDTLKEVVTQWQTVIDLDKIAVDGGGLTPLLDQIERLNVLFSNMFKIFERITTNKAFNIIVGSLPAGGIIRFLDEQRGNPRPGDPGFIGPTRPQVMDPRRNPTPGININVSGAVDPNATAKAVQNALNQAGRMGGYSWAGKGTG